MEEYDPLLYNAQLKTINRMFELKEKYRLQSEKLEQENKELKDKLKKVNALANECGEVYFEVCDIHQNLDKISEITEPPKEENENR